MKANELGEVKFVTKTSIFPLCLQASVMEELKKVVAEEGTTINQFINVAVAEKLATLRTAQYFKERAARADMKAFWEILEQAGTEEPRDGDELPESIAADRATVL